MKTKRKARSVFFVTSIELEDILGFCPAARAFYLPHHKSGRLLDNRTWGWYHSLKDAKIQVEQNGDFLHECSYSWVCTEEIEEGILWTNKSYIFYEWDKKEKRYKAIKGWPKKLDNYFEEHQLLRRLTTIG